MRSMRTQRKPPAASMLISPGRGSVKWVLTPRAWVPPRALQEKGRGGRFAIPSEEGSSAGLTEAVRWRRSSVPVATGKQRQFISGYFMTAPGGRQRFGASWDVGDAAVDEAASGAGSSGKMIQATM